MAKRKYVNRKFVVITTFGTLPTLGSITGPILTPFFLSTESIYHLINTKHEVKEVLEDGTQIVLTKDNYNIVNEVETKEEEKVVEKSTTVPQGQSGAKIEVIGEQKTDNKQQEQQGNKNNNNQKNNNQK